MTTVRDGWATLNKDWLALTMEEAIETDLPICDTHHHLWDRPNNRYLLEDFLKDTGAGHNIVKTVFVQCTAMFREDGPPEMRPIGETEFVQGIAAQSASGLYGKTRVAAGIVSFADFTLGAAVAPVLEAHMAASPNRFRGIRQILAGDASPEIKSYVSDWRLALSPKFREGFARLQDYGLSFDATVNHPQLMDLLDLARSFPNIPIILDHLGGPLGIGPYAGRREDVMEVWKKGIAALATCPNVSVKLGGLGIPNRGFAWHQLPKPLTSSELAEAIKPYYLWCIEKFGVDRCMFESNFPVDKLAYSYTVLWNACKLITRDFSAAERIALFHDTAVKVYRL